MMNAKNLTRRSGMAEVLRWVALVVLLIAVVLGAFHIKQLEREIDGLRRQVTQGGTKRGNLDSTLTVKKKDTVMVSVVIPQSVKVDISSKKTEGKQHTSTNGAGHQPHRGGTIYPPSLHQHRYLVSSGIFPDRYEADALRRFLIVHGYPASLRDSHAGSYVVVGPIDDHRSAEHYRDALTKTAPWSSFHIVERGHYGWYEGASLP